jgi:predicted RNase H-like nuclease
VWQVTRVLGVDGWRGGWIGARVEPGVDNVEWLLLPTAATVLDVATDVTAVDIPMGLLESGKRTCDQQARDALGIARSSVFFAPVRPVLEFDTYPEALAGLRAQGLAVMSAQAFGIVKKVKAMDAVLTPGLQERVVEAHPELSFRRLANVPTMPGKKTAAGVAVRLEALRGWLPNVDRAMADVPKPVPIDDALDALVCAWTAQRVLAGSFDRLGDGERDSKELRMQIIDPRSGQT